MVPRIIVMGAKPKNKEEELNELFLMRPGKIEIHYLIVK